jgi:hypothetical protein
MAIGTNQDAPQQPGRRRLAPTELLAVARALRTKGALAQAEHSYRQVLKHLPDLAAAHNDLGTVCAARALR